MIVVLSGPGGVGKGTIVRELLARSPQLWLSRSWTTRAVRPGEDPEAYVFVDRATFLAHRDAGGFFEWTEFLGNFYGTPLPDPPDESIVVLEIELDGARQVKQLAPDAVLIFLLPPSRDEQRRRLLQRGDSEHKALERLQKAEEEEPLGIELSDHAVVNDDLEHTVATIVQIISDEHAKRPV
jgi:guanylate kinase